MGVDKSNKALAYTLGKPRIKEGRRCGLCGGGTDGKPPKRVVQDIGESENEACSGSSASDEPYGARTPFEKAISRLTKGKKKKGKVLRHPLFKKSFGYIIDSVN